MVGETLTHSGGDPHLWWGETFAHSGGDLHPWWGRGSSPLKDAFQSGLQVICIYTRIYANIPARGQTRASFLTYDTHLRRFLSAASGRTASAGDTSVAAVSGFNASGQQG
jgi:hypothetical protein